jgi:hypothetical protein
VDELTTIAITQDVQSAAVLYSCITKPVDELTIMQVTDFIKKNDFNIFKIIISNYFMLVLKFV